LNFLADKTSLLVSFKNLEEIDRVLKYVDIVDLKNPENGSIGSWKIEDIIKAVKAFKKKTIISATLGDIFIDDEIFDRLSKFDKLGLDFVKIGIFKKKYSEFENFLGEIKKKNIKTNIVLVFFVEDKNFLKFVFDNLKKLKDSRIKVILLDTYVKNTKSLLDICPRSFLEKLVNRSNFFELQIGLAGKINAKQIPQLIKLGPKIIGLRSGVCKNNNRISEISVRKIKKVSSYFSIANKIAIDNAGA